MNECCEKTWPRFRSWCFDLGYDKGIQVKRIIFPCGHEWEVFTHNYRYNYWREVGQMKLPLAV